MGKYDYLPESTLKQIFALAEGPLAQAVAKAESMAKQSNGGKYTITNTPGHDMHGRPRHFLTVAQPGGEAIEAKHSVLTGAASGAGFDIKRYLID